MPAILDSLFHKVINTTSRPIVVEGGGGGEQQSSKHNFLWPNNFNPGRYQLHISQNVAKPMSSLTSQSCSDSLLTDHLARKVGAIHRPPEHPWMPDRPINEA